MNSAEIEVLNSLDFTEILVCEATKTCTNEASHRLEHSCGCVFLICFNHAVWSREAHFESPGGVLCTGCRLMKVKMVSLTPIVKGKK